MPGALVTIGSYSTPYEAHLAKSKLEAFEVKAVLADEYTINANWLWSNLLGGIKLQVPESQAEQALAILESEPLEEADLPDPRPSPCPACGSANAHPFIDKRGSILTWLFLGFPVLPTRVKEVCGDCGCQWKS